MNVSVLQEEDMSRLASMCLFRSEKMLSHRLHWLDSHFMPMGVFFEWTTSDSFNISAHMPTQV